MKRNVSKHTSLVWKCLLSVVMLGIILRPATGALEPSDMSLAMFISGRITDPTVFKVKVKIASEGFAYNGLLYNDNEVSAVDIRNSFWAVHVRSFNSRRDASQESLFCYVKKDSSTGKIIAEALKDGAYPDFPRSFETPRNFLGFGPKVFTTLLFSSCQRGGLRPLAEAGPEASGQADPKESRRLSSVRRSAAA